VPSIGEALTDLAAEERLPEDRDAKAHGSRPECFSGRQVADPRIAYPVTRNILHPSIAITRAGCPSRRW
jgi:hypothetical protein